MMLILDERRPPPPRIPFFKANPPVVVGLAGVIILASVVQFLAPPAIEAWMYDAGAIAVGAQYEGLPRPFGPLAPLVLHIFLHAGLVHLGLNMWALISFGAIVARWMGSGVRGAVGFLAFFALCAVGGAVAQIAVFELGPQGGVAIGASSAISGLLPALGWLQGRWRGAVRVSAPWFLINVALAVFGGLSPIPIAWAAHIGGLIAGFSFPVFLAWARS